MNPSLLVAAAVVAVGAGAVWANPKRPINRVFFTASLHVALWLVMFHATFKGDNELVWIWAACIVSAFIPAHLWVLKETIVKPAPWASMLRGALPFLIAGFFMAAIVPTAWFIPPESTAENPIKGFGFYAYMGGHALLFSILCRDAIRSIRIQNGVARIELQILLLGGSVAGFVIIALMAARVLFETRSPIPLQPIVVLIFYAATVLAITTHRIFDARFLILVSIQRILLILTVSAIAFIAHSAFVRIFPATIALLATVGVALWLGGQLNNWLEHVLGRYPRAPQARGAALAAARQAHSFEELQAQLLSILKGWGSVENAFIITGTGERFIGERMELLSDDPTVLTLKDLRWVTPERLGRERETARTRYVLQFLKDHQIGALVYAGSPTYAILVGVGVRPSRRPFIYPEIVQLLELGSIMESALARTHLSAKAQRAEQLATVGMLGASVAHEIRNPLVTIKSFVHLLPQHYGDPTFRERFFRLIGEEVGRIDRLTEQLLDLASPRHYNPAPTSLHQVIISSLDLVATKADERRVALHHDLLAAPDTVVTDANAARQVLLNLCFNGIQAQEQGNGDRWVRVATRKIHKGIELCVADNGPGIPAESRAHLFQAFHSTKSSGFGLGLVICHEILSSLDASIAVDPFVSGEGARFRIVFPCPQPTS